MPHQQRLLMLATIGHVVLAVSAANAQTDANRFETKVLPVLAKQCFQCHGEKAQIAGVNFSVFHDGAGAAEKPELWTRVREKISAHLMPPPPLAALSAADAATVNEWIDTLGGAPKTASADSPGRVTARRLNRLEFNNT